MRVRRDSYRDRRGQETLSFKMGSPLALGAHHVGFMGQFGKWLFFGLLKALWF